MSEKLKPCPRCENQNLTMQNDCARGQWIIECEKCSYKTGDEIMFNTEEAAISAWNRRAYAIKIRDMASVQHITQGLLLNGYCTEIKTVYKKYPHEGFIECFEINIREGAATSE